MSLSSTPPGSRPNSTVPPQVPSPLRDGFPAPVSPTPSSPSTPVNRPGARKPSISGTTTPSTSRPGGRARDLLRKHYGLGVGPPPPIANVSQDPMNLDSPVFDAKSYYDQLITTSSLQSLLKKDNELLAEIRQLEGERQALVYNHHHELIAASDTISAVKSRAESLESDLDLLKVAFSEISRLASEVSIQPDEVPPQ